MGELEEAVGANLWPLEALGNPYRVFQGFRRLLSLETPELKNSPLLGEIPPLVVAHHLFSRAPSALQSPHARAGFTPQQVTSLAMRCKGWACLLVHMKFASKYLQGNQANTASCGTEWEPIVSAESHRATLSGSLRRQRPGGSMLPVWRQALDII